MKRNVNLQHGACHHGKVKGPRPMICIQPAAEPALALQAGVKCRSRQTLIIATASGCSVPAGFVWRSTLFWGRQVRQGRSIQQPSDCITTHGAVEWKSDTFAVANTRARPNRMGRNTAAILTEYRLDRRFWQRSGRSTLHYKCTTRRTCPKRHVFECNYAGRARCEISTSTGCVSSVSGAEAVVRVSLVVCRKE